MTRCPEPRFATRAVHAGAAPDPATGARAVPIYHTNGFAFNDLEHGADIFALRQTGFSYSRGSNPTNAALERRVAALEGGTAAIAVASGQSALLMIILTLCESGDEFVATTQSFGGSLGLIRRLDNRLKIKANWAAPTPEAIEAAITPGTKAIFIESIVNPTGLVVDVPGIAAVAKAHNLPLVVDNTLATPALLRPFEHGADIVWHSASKFMCSSGIAIGGVIVDGGRFDWRADKRFPLISEPWGDYDNVLLTDVMPTSAFAAACRLVGLRELGPGLSPTNAFFVLMGIETLPLRMERHCENARAVASFLDRHAAVEAVSYPALPGNPNHNLATALCPNGIGSIFIVTLKGGKLAAKRALDRLQLFSHLVNIGETRSLVCHPATTTHKNLTQAERDGFGICEGTLRLSIGLENAEDLIADLDQALAA